MCYGYGKTGHFRRNCLEISRRSFEQRSNNNRFRRDDEPQAFQSIQQSREAYNVPPFAGGLSTYAEVTINDIKTCAFVDTGVAVIVVSESFYRSYSHCDLLECPINTRFVGAGAFAIVPR